MRNKKNENSEEPGHGQQTPGMFRLEKVAEEILDTSPRHYRRLAEAGIVPKPIRGEIHLVLAFKMLLAYYKKLSRGQGIDGLIDARKKNIEHKNDLLVIEKLFKQGDLMRREEVLAEFLWRISLVKQALLNLHRTLIPALNGLDSFGQSAVVRKVCRNLLEEFSRPTGIIRRLMADEKIEDGKRGESPIKFEGSLEIGRESGGKEVVIP